MSSDQDIFCESDPVASPYQDCYDPFYLRPPDSIERFIHEVPIPHERKTTSSPPLSPEHPYAGKKAPNFVKRRPQESLYEWSREERGDDIFHQDESQCMDQERIPRIGVPDGEGISERTVRRSRSGREVAGSSDAKGKKNDHATKNFLQFAMKVCKNYLYCFFQDENSEEAKAAWERLVREKGITNSLKGFTQLFQCRPLRRCWRRMLKSHHLRREIIGSGVDSSLKLIYLKMQQSLRRGFRKGRLDFLN